MGPDGAADGADAFAADDDEPAADDRRAGVTDRARRGRQLGPPVSFRVEALHRRGISGDLQPAPADGVQVRAVRRGRQVIARNWNAGGVVPAGAVENLGRDDRPRGRAGGPPADNDNLVPHHRRRAGATPVVQCGPRTQAVWAWFRCSTRAEATPRTPPRGWKPPITHTVFWYDTIIA